MNFPELFSHFQPQAPSPAPPSTRSNPFRGADFESILAVFDQNWWKFVKKKKTKLPNIDPEMSSLEPGLTGNVGQTLFAHAQVTFGRLPMEMNRRSTATYLALTPCLPLSCFHRSGSKGALRLPGATWDHFRCTVEPPPGHIRCRVV